ncbi:hypothetical protein [Geoalkalibacter subterraneus]|nr:hypothetical protein [Geoalkalibacter subterraneus]
MTSTHAILRKIVSNHAMVEKKIKDLRTEKWRKMQAGAKQVAA